MPIPPDNNDGITIPISTVKFPERRVDIFIKPCAYSAKEIKDVMIPEILAAMSDRDD